MTSCSSFSWRSCPTRILWCSSGTAQRTLRSLGGKTPTFHPLRLFLLCDLSQQSHGKSLVTRLAIDVNACLPTPGNAIWACTANGNDAKRWQMHAMIEVKDPQSSMSLSSSIPSIGGGD